MHLFHNLIYSVMLGASVVLLPACNGIFEDLYDAPEPAGQSDFGFVAYDAATRTGRIYIDATSYTEWHYIDFAARTVSTVTIGEEAAPAEWQLAIHRYDAKTNGGEVLETAHTGFDVLRGAGRLPDGEWEADRWTTDRIATDMSGMMDGVILYAEDYCNETLSRWLDVDTSTMPPIYTLSRKVYLCRFPDGTVAALQLTDFMNDAAVKGFMTIDYCYPFEF